MSDQDETIRVLREALKASPDNVSLRRHLADLLTKAGRHDDAVTEFREALKHAPSDPALKVGLARAYLANEQASHAGVVLESVLQASDAPADAYVLMARVALREGDVPRAVEVYKRGIELDPDAADPVLSDHLGVRPAAQDDEEEDDESEVFEGRLRNRASEGEADDDASGKIERPKIRFDDVGGMQSVKEEIDIKIIQPLLQPDLYRAYGKEIGGGILLYGPPGCGKTYLARATAGQVEASFMAVGLSEVMSMWIGESERNLHKLFDRARRQTPFVLFFDEVDALGANRTDMKTSGMRMVINQFLEELDGAKASNDGVLVLAATNAPWHLDPAFRRPGRFDRILFVPPPDEEARAAILEVMLKGKPTEKVDYVKLAKKTEGFSGADLKGVVDLAIEGKLREAMKVGRPAPLTSKDLLGAAKRVKPSTREWFATARNYVLYSNEGGLYDDVERYLDR